MADNKTFDELVKLDVSKYVEKKNGLNYLSWAFAWKEFKKHFPTATYEIKRDANGLPYVYDSNTGYMVFTEIDIDGHKSVMWLPVMDNNNYAMKSAPYEVKTKYKTITVAAATMFDVNKALMRCLVKNIAVCSGIGLSLYASEDLPFTDDEADTQPTTKTIKKIAPTCKACKQPVEAGGEYTAEQVAAISVEKYGAAYCSACRTKLREAEKAKAEIKAAKAAKPKTKTEIVSKVAPDLINVPVEVPDDDDGIQLPFEL